MPKYFNQKDICIYASELSNLIQISNFKSPAVTLLRIWEKNFPSDFRLHKQCLNDQNKELAENNTSEETFNKFKKSLSKEKQKKICVNMEKCMEAKDAGSMLNKRRELLKECEDLSVKDKQKIEKSIIEMTNTNFGIRNEDKSIHIYTQLTGVPVLPLKQFVKKILIRSNDYNWYIGGKIDGILEDRTVIEVKNRVHKLFNKVRDYEKVQTYCYMYILDSNKSHLVETHMNGKVPEVDILDVEYNQDYWEFILNRILVFIDYFNKFIESSTMKEQLLLQGVDNYKINLF